MAPRSGCNLRKGEVVLAWRYTLRSRILAQRGEKGDPIAFAIRDRRSMAVTALYVPVVELI